MMPTAWEESWGHGMTSGFDFQKSPECPALMQRNLEHGQMVCCHNGTSNVVAFRPPCDRQRNARYHFIALKKVGKLIDNKTIVAGLTFGIEKGSLVAIIGANDAGKSILLKLLSGFEKPDYGNVFIHGLDMQKRKIKTRRLIGYVPHETDLDPWLTIEQNIQFSSRLFQVNNKDYLERLSFYSDLLNIVEYLGELASRVSYGIQKKAMIVRALIHNPDILILDEPTGFMDAPSIRMTWDLLKKLKDHRFELLQSW